MCENQRTIFGPKHTFSVSLEQDLSIEQSIKFDFNNDQLKILSPNINGLEEEDFLSECENYVWKIPDKKRYFINDIQKHLGAKADKVLFVIFVVTNVNKLHVIEELTKISNRFRYIAKTLIVINDDNELGLWLRDLYRDSCVSIAAADNFIRGKVSNIDEEYHGSIFFEIEEIKGEDYGPKMLPPSFFKNGKVYALREGGFLLPIETDIKKPHQPSWTLDQNSKFFSNTSIFKFYNEKYRKLGRMFDSQKTLTHPYALLVSNGAGPRNSMGFRTQYDIEPLYKRENHIVIAMFGGSALHGDECWHDNTISAFLERMLRGSDDENIKKFEWTVLNFGMSGFNQQEEIDQYIFFCKRLKPDIVISHSGFNDVIHGMLCHNHTMKKYDTILNFPRIAKNSIDKVLSNNVITPNLINSPSIIAKSYINSTQFFHRMSSANGAKIFIKGLQPVGLDITMSKDEEESINWTKEYYKDTLECQHLDKVSHCYKHLRNEIKRIAGSDDMEPNNFFVIDLHDHFLNNKKNDQTFFLNFMHTTTNGNKLIAMLYYKFLEAYFRQ